LFAEANLGSEFIQKGRERMWGFHYLRSSAAHVLGVVAGEQSSKKN
jgi:hypothetical protein